MSEPDEHKIRHLPGNSHVYDPVDALSTQILEESELQGLEMFFGRHLELFFKAVSQLYPLDEALLDRFQDRWEWLVLSMNEALPWSDAFIDHYKDHWHWWRLSDNSGLSWSEELIERYRDRWDWEWLSCNKGLPWSERLIERFCELWDWSVLSDNSALPWSVGFIDCYCDKWDWKTLSGNKTLPWSNALIERHRDRWYLRELEANKTPTADLDGINRCSDNSKFEKPRQNEVQRWSSRFYECRATHWNAGKALPSFANYVRQLTVEQVVRLLDSYLEAAGKTEATYAVYNLRTSFLREPGDMGYCPSCGSRIIRSEIEPSKTVARDMSDSNLIPLHYYSRLYLCSACAWWSVRERWGFLEIDCAEYDYLIAGMAKQKDLAGKREAQPWRLALETESYLPALPLPHAWGDLFSPYYS